MGQRMRYHRITKGGRSKLAPDHVGGVRLIYGGAGNTGRSIMIRRAIVALAALCLCLFGIAGCQCIAGLGADLHDGANAIQKALQSPPSYRTAKQ